MVIIMIIEKSVVFVCFVCFYVTLLLIPPWSHPTNHNKQQPKIIFMCCFSRQKFSKVVTTFLSIVKGTCTY